MLIDGKAVAQQIHSEVADAVAALPGRPPALTAVLVGNDPASQTYVATKQRACQNVGMTSEILRLPADISQEELLEQVDNLNRDDLVDGILIQLPLPPHIDVRLVMLRLDPAKDVDGLHPVNLGRLLGGQGNGFIPCTPAGIRELLLRYDVPLEGAEVVIAGRSNIVGKPLAALLLQKGTDATITLVHSRTRDLHFHTARADILVAAMGQPGLIGPNMIREGAVIIDVGITRVDDQTMPKGYRLLGDVDFDAVKDKASLITPVPGGVGPMTVAMLLRNTYTAAS